MDDVRPAVGNVSASLGEAGDCVDGVLDPLHRAELEREELAALAATSGTAGILILEGSEPRPYWLIDTQAGQ